jgi:hypothetical protein
VRHPEEAASELFSALQRFAPNILRALRDAKGQCPIDAWASANRIAYRSVMSGAEYLRVWWEANPRKAQDLRIVKVICGIAGMPKPLPPAEERWLSAVWPTVEPPDPMAESLADWLRRARTL